MPCQQEVMLPLAGIVGILSRREGASVQGEWWSGGGTSGDLRHQSHPPCQSTQPFTEVHLPHREMPLCCLAMAGAQMEPNQGFPGPPKGIKASLPVSLGKPEVVCFLADLAILSPKVMGGCVRPLQGSEKPLEVWDSGTHRE